MLYHILAVGDVVMEPGLRHLERHLRPLQKWKTIDFTVVNGENAARSGADPRPGGADLRRRCRRGDLGEPRLRQEPDCGFPGGRALAAAARQLHRPGPGPGLRCLRPGRRPDPGAEPDRPVRPGLGADNPFTAADRLLERDAADFTLVDFHAEATSEKLAMGYYLDGRVSALWGPIPTCPPLTSGCVPRARAILRIWE